jgi:hypothetical protein
MATMTVTEKTTQIVGNSKQNLATADLAQSFAINKALFNLFT